MWRLYAQSNEAVAVRSTYKRLRDCLPYDEKSHPCVYIGEVQYIDYEHQPIPEGNLFWPFLHKRRSFQHERELRGVVLDSGGLADSRPGLPGRPELPGLPIDVDLNVLIESVYVAPTSPGWFRELVGRVLKRYGLPHEPRQSALDAAPLW